MSPVGDPFRTQIDEIEGCDKALQTGEGYKEIRARTSRLQPTRFNRTEEEE